MITPLTDSIQETIREALAKDAALMREAVEAGDEHAAQIEADIAQAQEYFEEVLAKGTDAPQDELQHGANRITTIMSALNSLAQEALHTFARSPMQADDAATMGRAAERAAAAAQWLSRASDHLFGSSVHFNKVPYPHIAADIIATQAIAKQPARIRDILAMRDLARALGELEREALSARLRQPDSLREPIAVHTYFAQHVGHAVALADAVADRFAASTIEGFGADAYQQLTLNLRFVQNILRPELPARPTQGE